MYEMSADEMVQNLPMFQNWSPCLDGSFIAEEVHLGMLSSCKGEAGRPKWCEKLLIGDVGQDVSCSLFRDCDDSDRNRERFSKLELWTIPTSWQGCTIPSQHLVIQKRGNDY